MAAVVTAAVVVAAESDASASSRKDEAPVSWAGAFSRGAQSPKISRYRCLAM